MGHPVAAEGKTTSAINKVDRKEVFVETYSMPVIGGGIRRKISEKPNFIGGKCQ